MEQSADLFASLAADWREQPPALTQPLSPYWWDADYNTTDYGTIFAEGETYYHEESRTYRVRDGECLNPSPEDETLLGPKAFAALAGLPKGWGFASVPESVTYWPAWKRERWGRTAVLVDDRHEQRHEPTYLTAPEYVLALTHRFPRHIRKQADHDVAALMAATMLVARGPDELQAAFPSLPPYRGEDPVLPPPSLDPLAKHPNRRYHSVLNVADVRAAWPSWTLAWRAVEALSPDGDVVTPLSRFQVSPWCGLAERKAEILVAWLETNGYIEAEAVTTMYGHEASDYRLVEAEAEAA